MLANVYLHYALDLWFERVVQCSCKGAAFLHRYADDFVCGFGRAEEAVTYTAKNLLTSEVNDMDTLQISRDVTPPQRRNEVACDIGRN